MVIISTSSLLPKFYVAVIACTVLLFQGVLLVKMNPSTHDLLRACAQRLIQTADRIAGHSVSSTSTSTPSSTTTSTTAGTGTATSSVATINSAPPLSNRVQEEHRRIFGFRPSATSSRASRGARGFSYSTRRNHPYPRAGQTWTRSFVCLASKSQDHPPSASQRIELSLNGLGERKIEFPKYGNGAQVHETIVGTFAQLGELGYEVLRCGEGRSKSLLRIPMPSSGFSVEFLKSALGQAKGYLRPLQRDIPMQNSCSSSNQSETVTTEKNQDNEEDIMVKCLNCNLEVAMVDFSAHNINCNGGPSSEARNRSQGIERFCTTSTPSPSVPPGSSVNHLQQLFPDTPISEIEQVLESFDGDASLAADALLKEPMQPTGVVDQDDDLMLSVWCSHQEDKKKPPANTDLSSILNKLYKKLTGPDFNVTVDEKTALVDAMLIYKNPAFDETQPLTIKFGNQPALDVGGTKREFFTRVFQELTHDDNSLRLDLFEGPPGRLMPRYSAPIVYSGVFNAVGKMIAHSIVQCGIGFPHLSPPAYWYLITGDVSKAVGYCCIADVKDVKAAAIIERLMNSQETDELLKDDEFISLLSDAGCSSAVRNRQLLVESLMLHTVLNKKTVVLDQLRKGLQTLKVLDHMTKAPTVFEGLFLCSGKELTSSQVKSCLQFREENANDETRDHLLKYINECSSEDLKNFLRFVTGSYLLPRGNISVVLSDEGECIFASTCLLEIHLPKSFIGYEQFSSAMKAICDPGAGAFNVL